VQHITWKCNPAVNDSIFKSLSREAGVLPSYSLHEQTPHEQHSSPLHGGSAAGSVKIDTWRCRWSTLPDTVHKHTYVQRRLWKLFLSTLLDSALWLDVTAETGLLFPILSQRSHRWVRTFTPHNECMLTHTLLQQTWLICCHDESQNLCNGNKSISWTLSARLNHKIIL